MTSPADPSRPAAPTVREIAALTARLREISARGRDVDPAEREQFLADKDALIARITATATEITDSPLRAGRAAAVRERYDARDALTEEVRARAEHPGYVLVGPSARTWLRDPVTGAPAAPVSEHEHRAVYGLLDREELDTSEPAWVTGPDGRDDVHSTVVPTTGTEDHDDGAWDDPDLSGYDGRDRFTMSVPSSSPRFERASDGTLSDAELDYWDARVQRARAEGRFVQEPGGPMQYRRVENPTAGARRWELRDVSAEHPSPPFPGSRPVDHAADESDDESADDFTDDEIGRAFNALCERYPLPGDPGGPEPAESRFGPAWIDPADYIDDEVSTDDVSEIATANPDIWDDAPGAHAPGAHTPGAHTQDVHAQDVHDEVVEYHRTAFLPREGSRAWTEQDQQRQQVFGAALDRGGNAPEPEPEQERRAQLARWHAEDHADAPDDGTVYFTCGGYETDLGRD